MARVRGFDISYLLDLGEGFVAGLVLALAVATVIAVIGLFVLPLVLFLVELVALAAAIYVLGKPWVVEATTAGPPPETVSWRVRGWRRSRRAVKEVARELEAGLHGEPEGAEAP